MIIKRELCGTTHGKKEKKVFRHIIADSFRFSLVVEWGGVQEIEENASGQRVVTFYNVVFFRIFTQSRFSVACKMYLNISGVFFLSHQSPPPFYPSNSPSPLAEC